MFLAPVFGYLGDRYNRKYIMSGGITFWSLVTLASSYTPKEVREMFDLGRRTFVKRGLNVPQTRVFSCRSTSGRCC